MAPATFCIAGVPVSERSTSHAKYAATRTAMSPEIGTTHNSGEASKKFVALQRKKFGSAKQIGFWTRIKRPPRRRGLQRSRSVYGNRRASAKRRIVRLMRPQKASKSAPKADASEKAQAANRDWL